MQCHKAKIDGNLLKRGFWIYLYVIKQGQKEIFYVGRTGDSSSANAGSPFERLTGHLNRKFTAKSAAMLRQLTKYGFNVEKCTFELFAFGPIHPEQKDFERHKVYRDILASLEKAIAAELGKRGYTVVGTHSSKVECSPELLSLVLEHEEFIWRSLG